MSGTGNTTVPTGPESGPRGTSSPRLALALVLCWSAEEPERIGEVATFEHGDPGPFVIGRERGADGPRVHFWRRRPGASVDGGALSGVHLSREQLRVSHDGDSLRIQALGMLRTFVDRELVPQGASTVARVGSVIELRGHSVFMVTRRRAGSLIARGSALSDHPFGEADAIGIVGESQVAWDLRDAILFAASAGRHVLVIGPTGTGKELAARGIHALSARARGPFIAANVADFTAALTSSLLYGNPANYPNVGAQARPGFFGEARGGTLLLDEIGLMPEDMQGPLLRALEGAYTRVGDSKVQRTECVVVCATNAGIQSLKRDVRMRLSIVVETPALADRREDVPLIVRAKLLERLRGNPALMAPYVIHAAGGAPRLAVDASLIVGLLYEPLSGNVREVDNILLEALYEARDTAPLRWPSRRPILAPAPVPSPSESSGPATTRTPVQAEDLIDGIRAAPEPTEARLRKALEHFGWHQGNAAEAIGISRQKLQRLMARYGIKRPG